MTFDRSTKTSNARPSAAANPPGWSTRGEQKPVNGKPSTPTAQPILRREAQINGTSVLAADNTGDESTPAKAFLNSNITPRSGSRKARVESSSSTPRMTPESTPPIARPTSMIEGRDWTSGEPKIARGFRTNRDLSRPTRAQSVVSDMQCLNGYILADGQGERQSRTASPDTLPKFFHASEVKPGRGARPPSQSPRLQPRLAGLKYTNGASNVDASTLSLSPESGDERPKFFHADGSQPANSSTPRLANGAFSARPPLQTIFSSYQTNNSPVQRPPSPLKEELVPISRKSSLNKPSPRRHTRLVSRGSNDIRAPDSLINGQSNLSRRSSLNDSAKRNSQPQSPGIARFEHASSRRSSIALSDSGRRPTPVIPPESTYLDASPTEPTITTSPEPHLPESPNRPAPGQSKLDHLNELAANARRERKVLDLEISNSSLLAINRTLEAEMRKQKAELRHLRRLRSSGRFPSSSARSGSSRFSMPSASDDLSPTSSADEDEEVDDDRFSDLSSGTSDDTSFPDSLSFSPTLRNSSMIPVAKGRQSRTQRLDLSAQRTLLQDSQKLNQALKRCLGRTDELIADGKKALEYKVDTSELAIPGPRVLVLEDRDEELELGRGLLSPGLEERVENPWERAGKLKEDRDTPRSENLEALTPDLSGHNGQTQKRDRMDGCGEQEILTSSPPIDAEVPFRDPDTHSIEDLRTTDTRPTAAQENIPPKTPYSISGRLEIPYEDPGIDTGSETSALGLNLEQQADLTAEPHNPIQGSTNQESTSPGSSTDSASEGETEPTIEPSSPGKSLGNFLRMVGGSWGV